MSTSKSSFYEWLKEYRGWGEVILNGPEPQWDKEDEYTIRTIDPADFPKDDIKDNRAISFLLGTPNPRN